MQHPFQKTLYRSENGLWHYIRLIWQEEHQSFDVRTAPCGQVAATVRQEALLAGEAKETALHRLVSGLQEAGYSANPPKDKRLDITVFTPLWDGFFGAAPWLETLQFEVLYPLEDAFMYTANGGNRGGTTVTPDSITQFLWILDMEAAMEAIALIRQKASPMFRIEVMEHQKTEIPVRATLDEPSPLSAESLQIASTLQQLMSQITQDIIQKVQPLMGTVARTDTTWPDSIYGLADRIASDRVLGEKAAHFRSRLLEQWGVGKGSWPPLGHAAPCETLHMEAVDDETAAQLIALIRHRIIGQVYALDAMEGLFMSEPERLFFRFSIGDTYWFDEGLEWIMYVSHEQTITFGGDWLIAAIREFYREQPECLNPWFAN